MSLTHMCLQGSEEGVGFPAAAIPGMGDLPDMGAGIKLGSFRKITSSLTLCIISPAPHTMF